MGFALQSFYNIEEVSWVEGPIVQIFLDPHTLLVIKCIRQGNHQLPFVVICAGGFLGLSYNFACGTGATL